MIENSTDLGILQNHNLGYIISEICQHKYDGDQIIDMLIKCAIVCEVNPSNKRYLETKKEKLGHLLDKEGVVKD